MSPAQCCRSSTEPLEEQILRAVGAQGHSPCSLPLLRGVSLPPALKESHQPVPFVLWGVTPSTPELSPRSQGAVQQLWVQIPALSPTPGGSGSAWREGGWLAELLFVVLDLKCRIITKASGSQSSSSPAQNSNDKSAKNSGHFSSCSTGPSRLPSNLIDPRPTTTAFKYPK